MIRTDSTFQSTLTGRAFLHQSMEVTLRLVKPARSFFFLSSADSNVDRTGQKDAKGTYVMCSECIWNVHLIDWNAQDVAARCRQKVGSIVFYRFSHSMYFRDHQRLVPDLGSRGPQLSPERGEPPKLGCWR